MVKTPIGWHLLACWLIIAWLGMQLGLPIYAAEDPLISPAHRALVVVRLLPLLHAPEVHAELHLKPNQIEELEQWFQENDGEWLRARSLPPDQNRAAVDQLESRARNWLQTRWSNTQRQRLKQLEWQALGTRVVFRTDLAQAVQITPFQLQKFVDLAKATDDARRKARRRETATPDSAAIEALNAAIEAENRGPTTILTPDQQRRLGVQLGEKFDVSQLSRIYPLAPDFGEGADWVNSDPKTLHSYRGQVVLLIFFAGQDPHSQADFPTYRRWNEQLTQQGVILLGVHSPASPADDNVDALRQVAKDQGLNFPILLDAKSKQWQAWGNTTRPYLFVIDRKGYIRHWWQGELNWQGATGDKTIEDILTKCLAEDGS